jgi:FkbM family methyltransferase
LNGEVYEPQTIEFIRNSCGTGDIVHAGTYFGDFLPAISQGCAPDSKVWAFEPNPENFSCAQITVLINKLENVTLCNAGLGSKKDSLKMRTKDETGRALGGKSRLIGSGGFDPELDEEVQIVTIDDSVDNSRPVSIIQLDVEDHEKAALTGALDTIHRCRPILILEVRRGSDLLDSQWFATNILSLGYTQTGTLHNNTVFQCVGKPA